MKDARKGIKNLRREEREGGKITRMKKDVDGSRNLKCNVKK
jgi:hypothetical protein